MRYAVLGKKSDKYIKSPVETGPGFRNIRMCMFCNCVEFFFSKSFQALKENSAKLEEQSQKYQYYSGGEWYLISGDKNYLSPRCVL